MEKSLQKTLNCTLGYLTQFASFLAVCLDITVIATVFCPSTTAVVLVRAVSCNGICKRKLCLGGRLHTRHTRHGFRIENCETGTEVRT